MSTHNKGISNLFYKRDPGYKPTYIINITPLGKPEFPFFTFSFFPISCDHKGIVN